MVWSQQNYHRLLKTERYFGMRTAAPATNKATAIKTASHQAVIKTVSIFFECLFKKKRSKKH